MTNKYKKISIIIPTYNESATIREILKKVDDVDLGMEKEVIIVDNNSTDNTREILESYGDKYKLIYQKKNMGMSNSIRKGLEASTGDLLMKQDADLEYDPQDIKKLMEPILDGKADAVYGSRFLKGDSHAAWNFRHLIGNKILTYLSNLMTNMYLTDMETCYKLYTREIYEKMVLKSNLFEFEPEITAQLAKNRAKVWEVSVNYYPRSYSEGKKVKWTDGVHAIWTIFKLNLFSK